MPQDRDRLHFKVINRRRGKTLEEQRHKTPLFIVKADLPVYGSSCFTADLRSHTSGQAFIRCVFDYGDIVAGEPNVVNTKVGAIVAQIRQWKGLPGAVLFSTVSSRRSQTSHNHLFSLNEQTHHAFSFSKSLGKLKTPRPSTVGPSQSLFVQSRCSRTSRSTLRLLRTPKALSQSPRRTASCSSSFRRRPRHRPSAPSSLNSARLVG